MIENNAQNGLNQYKVKQVVYGDSGIKNTAKFINQDECTQATVNPILANKKRIIITLLVGFVTFVVAFFSFTNNFFGTLNYICDRFVWSSRIFCSDKKS